MVIDVFNPSERQFQELYDRIVAFVQAQGSASCYAIMKEFSIGYGKAVHFMDTMEQNGVIQPFLLNDDGTQVMQTGPRKLMTDEFKAFYTKYEADRQKRVQERKDVTEAARQQRLLEQQKAQEAATRALDVKPTRKKKK